MGRRMGKAPPAAAAVALLLLLAPALAAAKEHLGMGSQAMHEARFGDPEDAGAGMGGLYEDVSDGADDDAVFAWDEQSHPGARAAHAAMSAWLAEFYRSAPEGELHPPPRRAPALRPPPPPPAEGRPVPVYAPSARDARVWALPDGNTTCAEFMAARAAAGAPPPERRALLVAAVGDGFDAAASGWLAHPGAAAFDLVVIHYGGGTLSCPECRRVFRARGPKWAIVHAVAAGPDAAEWRRLVASYDAVMVADDDVVATTCALNRAFELFRAYALLLAQPSLCPTPHRATFWPHLLRRGGLALRFTTMVEIMGPIFERDFFQRLVEPSLYNAYTGWGYDLVWPFLLRYPRTRVAVLDEVCMTHGAPPLSKGAGGSVYAAPAPWGEREEEARRAAEFGYWASRLEDVGLPYRATEVLGEVPLGGAAEGGGGSGGAPAALAGAAAEAARWDDEVAPGRQVEEGEGGPRGPAPGARPGAAAGAALAAGLALPAAAGAAALAGTRSLRRRRARRERAAARAPERAPLSGGA